MTEGFAAAIYVLLFLLVLWRPPIAMAPVICMFGIEQFLMANSAYFRNHGSLVNLAIGILVLAGLCSTLLKGGKINYYWPLVGWLVLTLHGLYAASYFWAESPEWTISNLYFVAPYALTISFAFALLFRNLGDVRLGFIATVLMASLIAVLLITTTRIHEWGRTIDFGGNVAGTRFDIGRNRGNPLAIADLGAALAGIAVMLQLGKSQKWWSIFKWVAVFLGFALIFRSGSRGQFAGIVLATFALFKFSRPKISMQTILTTAFSLAIFGIIMLLALTYFGEGTRFDVTQFGESYSESRLDKCEVLLKEWVRSSPVQWMFGLGAAASWGIQGIYPHVVPVEVLCELGFVGLTLYVTIHILVILSFLRLGKLTLANPVDRATVATMAALFFFHWIMSLKQGSLIFFYHSYFIAILAARMEWQYGREHRAATARRIQQSLRNGPPVRKWISAFQK